ncbi:restriction endonuclease subunit S [Agathobacter rectalis]|uniref:Restriction endonuclease subunit S n=1 Tax=Agathobacter rectalis TaxID=39491 RepID=A0A415ICY9_9FIRM|nr:restriction endonuclease subunit S [Agathobacter rectalis]RHL05504.1 restriction endonuclease subunit S [Agathobacter rectalis]
MENPKIRFKGFTKDWEQRKFSDIASRESVSRESSYDLPSLEYEDVIAEEGRLNKDISLKENIKKGIVFDGSQVLYGKLRPYLHNWLNPDFSGVAVGDWWVLKPNNADKSFIYRLIQTQRFDDIANQSAGSKMPRADWNLVSNTEFAVPVSQEEQEKIGEYFSSLDHLITLHQRKCEQTKKLKKYMLQKMFPQNGAKVPEIRFYGFTYDWEQRKLGEIATETYGGGTPKTSNEEFWKGDIPWIQSSDLIDECLFDVRPRKCISQEAVSKSATKLVPQNSIAIVTRVGVGKLAFMPFSYATSQDFLSLSGLKIDPEFTVYALYKMMQSVSNEVQGTSIKGVTKDELLAKKIIFPSCNEQKKIGAYLHSLDNLITLHQRKCDELKKMKKYMLQNMFI